MVGRLLVKLALLAVAVFVAIQVSSWPFVVVAVAVALVALVFILGRFSAEWRNAGVTVARQHRRLTRRGGHR